MDFLKEIFRFFIDKEYSFTSKFVGLIVFILILASIDNFLGFSFYYSKNQKITQLKNIEDIKKSCFDNKELVKALNETEKDIINRKNILENFISLFSSQQLDNENRKDKKLIDTVYITKYDTLIIRDFKRPWFENYYNSLGTNYKSIFSDTDSIAIIYHNKNLLTNKSIDSLVSRPKIKINSERPIVLKSRSQLWHTITSSFLFIISFLIILIVPFTQKKIDWNVIAGVLILMIIDAALIWLFQYLLGLIPLIWNKPWINYALNIAIQSLIGFTIGLMIYKSNKNNKNAT